MLQASSGTICPYTVLLFEPRIDILLYESLKSIFYLDLIDFFSYLLIKLRKKLKKSNFRNFRNLSFFSEIFRISIRSFNLAITYREFWNLAQKNRHDSLYPKIK